MEAHGIGNPGRERRYAQNRHRRIRANEKDMQLYTDLRKELQALTGLVPLKTEPGSE